MLLRQAGEGNEQSFTELFYAYKDKLYAFILPIARSRETTEDILQDVFLKIWLRRKTLPEIDNFNAFIFRVCYNHTINQLRRMSRETLIRMESDQRANKTTVSAEDEFSYKHFRESLADIVSKLPPQQKTIYRLSKEESLRQEEIARQLDISVSTVKNHLSRALKTIRETLAKYYPNPMVVIILVLFHRH